jgi:hypothetical protein
MTTKSRVKATIERRSDKLTGSGMSMSLASLTVDAALRACPVVMVGSDMLAELLPVLPHNSRNKKKQQCYQKQSSSFKSDSVGAVIMSILHNGVSEKSRVRSVKRCAATHSAHLIVS